MPARHHDGLARHRLPGRARDREPVRRRLRHVDLAQRLAGDLAHARLPDHHRSAHHVRRAGAEDLLDRERRDDRVTRGAAAGAVPHDLQAADLAAEHGVELDPAPGGRERSRRVRGRQLLRGPEADHRPQPAWGQARSRRGRHALGRLPPARAAGASGDDTDPGGRDRGRLRDGRGGTAQGGRLGSHPPGGDRGRQHRPHQGHRARELAGAEGDDRGARSHRSRAA